MKKYIGLDVHSKQTVFCVQDETGRVMKEGAIDTDERGLTRLLDSNSINEGTKIGLESGSQAWWVATVMARHGMSPVVVDTHEVRAKARRVGQKTGRRLLSLESSCEF